MVERGSGQTADTGPASAGRAADGPASAGKGADGPASVGTGAEQAGTRTAPVFDRAATGDGGAAATVNASTSPADSRYAPSGYDRTASGQGSERSYSVHGPPPDTSFQYTSGMATAMLNARMMHDMTRYPPPLYLLDRAGGSERGAESGRDARRDGGEPEAGSRPGAYGGSAIGRMTNALMETSVMRYVREHARRLTGRE